MRVRVLRLTEEEHILIVVMHHIISDGWSMGVFMRELGALYKAYERGESAGLEELPIQYSDYAIWERGRPGSQAEGQMQYWKERLSGSSQSIEMPTDRARPAVASYRGASKEIKIEESVSRGLKELSRREGATLYMAVLAGFKVLLHRYSGQEDIVVGTPVAGRLQRETEGLIGLFANTLVIRSKLRAESSYKELLKEVKEAVIEGYVNQEVAFEKLVEQMQPQRDLSRSPLFQVMFELQNEAKEAREFAGLEMRAMAIDTGTAKFDLLLSMTQREEALTGVLEYSTDLYDESTISRMVGHLETLFSAIVREPDRAIGSLEMLSEAEQRQITQEWNQRQKEYSSSQCIHELIEQQAVRTPNAVALIYNHQRITYAELNGRANRLAHSCSEERSAPNPS